MQNIQDEITKHTQAHKEQEFAIIRMKQSLATVDALSSEATILQDEIAHAETEQARLDLIIKTANERLARAKKIGEDPDDLVKETETFLVGPFQSKDKQPLHPIMHTPIPLFLSTVTIWSVWQFIAALADAHSSAWNALFFPASLILGLFTVAAWCMPSVASEDRNRYLNGSSKDKPNIKKTEELHALVDAKIVTRHELHLHHAECIKIKDLQRRLASAMGYFPRQEQDHMQELYNKLSTRETLLKEEWHVWTTTKELPAAVREQTGLDIALQRQANRLLEP